MRGTVTGKQFVYGKDILELEREEDSTPVNTALYGRGKGVETESGEGYGRRLTFDDVVWTTAAGDPVDKPAGQEWVGDPAALARWGRPGGRHRFDVFTLHRMERQDHLFQALAFFRTDEAKGVPVLIVQIETSGREEIAVQYLKLTEPVEGKAFDHRILCIFCNHVPPVFEFLEGIRLSGSPGGFVLPEFGIDKACLQVIFNRVQQREEVLCSAGLTFFEMDRFGSIFPHFQGIEGIESLHPVAGDFGIFVLADEPGLAAVIESDFHLKDGADIVQIAHELPFGDIETVILKLRLLREVMIDLFKSGRRFAQFVQDMNITQEKFTF
jgi:hypothetical protein